MTCEWAQGLISPYLDGELDAAQRTQLETHLAECLACAGQLSAFRIISARMHEPELRYQPPAHLESRIKAALRAGPSRSIHPAWFAAAACFLLAIGMTWVAFVQQPRRAETRLIAQEIVSSHIRSLQANHLFDVPSEDRHTVKPWFDGRLSFSPEVKDLATQGFRLGGGRLDSIEGRTVAALVFQRRLHVLNLYIWPTTSPDTVPESGPSENGYNTVHWTHAGADYWAIADIPPDELRHFAALYLM